MKLKKKINKNLLQLCLIENKFYSINKKNYLEHSLIIKNIMKIIYFHNKCKKNILFINPAKKLKKVINKLKGNCITYFAGAIPLKTDLIISFNVSSNKKLFKECKNFSREKKLWVNIDFTDHNNKNFTNYNLLYTPTKINQNKLYSDIVTKVLIKSELKNLKFFKKNIYGKKKKRYF